MRLVLKALGLLTSLAIMSVGTSTLISLNPGSQNQNVKAVIGVLLITSQSIVIYELVRSELSDIREDDED